MDPKTVETFDGTIESAVDLMVSPELTEEPKAEEVEEESTEETQETETEEDTETEDDETTEPESEDEDDSDTESGADQEEPEESSAEMFTVKVDGAEEQVSLDDLKRGYSGQKYVQHGMKEAAEARKQAEDVYNNLMQERQQVAQLVGQIREGGFTPPPREPDKSTFEADPIGYMNAKIEYDEQKEAYDTQLTHLQGVAQRQGQADQAAMQAYLQGELKSLQAIEPDFADAETADKVKKAMVKTGEDVYGYSPEEISQIVDHRAIRVLRDAMRYHEIKTGSAKAKTKVKQKMASSKTKRRRPTAGAAQRRKQEAKLKSTGSLKDALGLLME